MGRLLKIYIFCRSALCSYNFLRVISFAGHSFRCRFVNGFQHFRHMLLLSMLRLGSFLIWLWELKELKAGPLFEDRATLDSFWWLKYFFSSIKTRLSASDGLSVAEKSFLWVSVFFMLQMKTSLIHSASSISLILQVLANSVSAAQNCSYDFRSLCLRFHRLYLSNVVLGGLLNAASS